MNQKNNKSNSIKYNSHKNILNPQDNRDEIKLKIMDKFGVTFEESEKILSSLEKKENVGNKKHRISNKSSGDEINSHRNQKNSNFHNDVLSKNDVTMNERGSFSSKNLNIDNNDINKKINDKSKNNNKTNKTQLHKNLAENNKLKEQNSDSNINKNQIKNSNPPDNHNNDSKNNIPKTVDGILDDIIPDYNKQISIDVNHVDLTFEVQNEKVDTLKESFVRVFKRNRPKKIKIHALKDISFKIYKGEKVGIIGYNGAGKSTLLNVISGIYPPDKGKVTTYGNISPLLSLGAGFDFNFSGRKNIILNGAVLGYSREFLESKMDEIIEFSELGKFIDIPIKNYSSGMFAKLGFSIATAVEPDILIIDEVLGVGDVNFQKKSQDKIKSLMDGGTTVLLVSHSIPKVRELCDKAIWIDNGSLREIGDVNKVCDEYIKDSEKATNEQLANIQFK